MARNALKIGSTLAYHSCHSMPSRLACLLVVLGAAGCFTVETKYEYPDDLTHPDYVKRSKAVKQFAAEKDERQLPRAFRLLMDSEAHIRAIAHETIRSLTPENRDFGYAAYLPMDVRAGIVARWEAWWLAQKNGAEAGDSDA